MRWCNWRTVSIFPWENLMRKDITFTVVLRRMATLGKTGTEKEWGIPDLGDPVYSIAHGVVVFSQDYGRGWGNVVIVRHAYRAKDGQIAFLDSLYGHFQKRMVKVGDHVKRGQQIGTIGRGPRNMYTAHLHFEIRKSLQVGMHRSKFPRDYSIYWSPRHFIRDHRKLRYEPRLVKTALNTFLEVEPESPDHGESGRARSRDRQDSAARHS